jgi:uncharacterized protein (DUF433 family)
MIADGMAEMEILAACPDLQREEVAEALRSPEPPWRRR